MSKNILFEETNDRYTLFPVKDEMIFDYYKKSLSMFWTCEEINFASDYEDFDKLNYNEKYFIKMILSFFASSDGVVNENLVLRFSNEVQLAEARAVYSVQNMIETIHSECYSLLIDTYIKDKDEKMKCFNAINEYPCIREKMEWGQKYITSTDKFNKRLLAFIIVEGLFFSGSFCAIYWLKKRGLMKGLTFANELISRDEGIHTSFAIYLYNTYCDRLDDGEIIQIFKEAVDIEKKFICNSLPCRLIGMNSELMCNYIEFVSDRLLSQLNYPKLYNKSNPFDFMELISLEGKTNFFEKRVSEYSLADGGDRSKAFNLNVDF